MIDSEPERSPRSTIQVFLGFLLGIALSLGCLILAIFLGGTLGPSRPWISPVINGIGLLLAGAVALRHIRESSFALGAVTAFSLALLLDAACGVVLYK